MALRDDVLTAVSLMSDAPSADDDTIAERLIAHGYDVLRAELLIAFVPLGLGRAVISRLPANPPISLSEKALIQDLGHNCTLEVALMDVPEYVIARQLGEETFLTGLIQPEHFRAVSGRSVELNLISEALEQGVNPGGAKIAPPILLRLAEAPSFKAWYQAINRRAGITVS